MSEGGVTPEDILKPTVGQEVPNVPGESPAPQKTSRPRIEEKKPMTETSARKVFKVDLDSSQYRDA